MNGINVNVNVNNTSRANAIGYTPASSASVVANTSKSSAEVLSSVTNSGTYAELSAAKTELAVGVDNLTAGFNESSSTYIDEGTQATLYELGISFPSLD